VLRCNRPTTRPPRPLLYALPFERGPLQQQSSVLFNPCARLACTLAASSPVIHTQAMCASGSDSVVVPPFRVPSHSKAGPPQATHPYPKPTIFAAPDATYAHTWIFSHCCSAMGGSHRTTTTAFSALTMSRTFLLLFFFRVRPQQTLVRCLCCTHRYTHCALFMRQSCLARRCLGAPQLSGSRVRHGVVIVSLEFAMLHTHMSVTDSVVVCKRDALLHLPTGAPTCSP
jgi:hypothetical protein